MEGPYVTALGHAGLRVDTSHVSVLLDPWVSPGGAFLGSWFPFPDNAHLPARLFADVDVVVVSHEHLDHLDLTLLAGLPDRVEVVVPRYPSPILERRLRRAGVRSVVVLDAWQRFRLPGRDEWLTVIPEQCPMSHDAGVLLHVGGRTILHANDARLSIAQVRRAMAEVRGPIDLLGVQMSGASWHPVCYDYTPEEMAAVTESKRIGKFRAATRMVRSVRPGLVIPYAGPPCFLDEPLFELNSGLHGPGVFPDQSDALEWLRAHTRQQAATYLLPGDRLELPSTAVHTDPQWRGFDLRHGPDTRRAYLEAYASRRGDEIREVWDENPEPAPGLANRLADHIESLGALSSYFLARIGITVRFEVSGPEGGVWDAQIGPDRLVVDDPSASHQPNYTFRVEGRWLDGVLRGRTRWEELLLSLRIGFSRTPDVYNDYLVGLLKHADRAALAAVEHFETHRDRAARFEVATPAGTRQIGRFCPHAGEDLAEVGVVEGDRIRCLGHNFEFDLGTGECLNANCEPLSVEGARERPSAGRLLEESR